MANPPKAIPISGFPKAILPLTGNEILLGDDKNLTTSTIPLRAISDFIAATHQLTFIQQVATTIWTIYHGWGMFPNATVVDSAGNQCFGSVSYPDSSTVVIHFSAPFSGIAYLI